MNPTEYLKFIQVIESHIELTLPFMESSKDCFLLKDLSDSCKVIKRGIQSQEVPQNPLECPLACLILANASHFVYLGEVFALELPEALQEMLFHFSLILIKGSPSIKSQLYEFITLLDPIWPKLVYKLVDVLDLPEHKTFKQAKSFAFQEAKKLFYADADSMP